MNNINNLKPFPRFCVTLGMIPTSYKESMTYEEQLLWLCNYLETEIIPKYNENVEAINELITLYNQLKEYVDNYFENLDVQEEINNKLDEMAESGELAEIITAYLQVNGVLAFNTINDLEAATNITEGSTCYTLGQNEYNDGKGAYYKIRTITSGDTVDHFNIVTVAASDTLIGERLPNYYINSINSNINNIVEDIEDLENNLDNKYNRTDNLFLQNYIIYDIPSTQYSQGSTNDANGNIYIYTTQDNNTGNLLVFNNEALVNTIQNVPFQHGNSILYKNNKIYSAIGSKKIKVLNLSNTTYEELNPFTDSQYNLYQEICGITNYDENNIICMLGYKTTESYISDINKLIMVKLNINTMETENITLSNTKHYRTVNLATQNVTYYNNHIYVLCSQPNMILDFIINENTADLNKIYNIAEKDVLGLVVGEVEQLSLIAGNPGQFILSTHVLENFNTGVRTIKTYCVSFDTELETLYHPIVVDDISAYRTPVYCNSGATNLYENGSSTYPFKSITRALEYVNYNKITDAEQILVSPGNYKLGTLYNIHKGNINEASPTGNVNFTGTTKLVNCDLIFNSIASNYYFAEINIDGGNITFNGTIHGSSIVEINSAYVRINGLISTHNVAESLIVRLRQSSFGIINITSKVSSVQTFYITGGSVCCSNDNTKVISGNGTFISTGSHNAD